MSLDTLKAKLRDVDTREVFVWRSGFEDWKPAADVAELTPPRPEEPPPFRIETQKRKPNPSNKPSVTTAARSAGAMAALAAVLAMFGIAGLLDAVVALPQWSQRTVANFFIWFTVALAFGAYHGAKQYVERKYSDISELPPILLGRFTRVVEVADEKRKLSDTREKRLDPTSKTAEKDWGQRLAEIADKVETRRKSEIS
jgi:hypothetical protein